MFNVRFLPSGKLVQVPAGNTILQVAISAGLQVQSTCSGRGTCGKCKVQILSKGNITLTSTEQKVLSEREKAEGWVLACQHSINSDTDINIYEHKDAHARKTIFDEQVPVELAPAVRKCLLKLQEPSAKSQVSDWECLVAALPDMEINFNLKIAANLPRVLRHSKFQVTAVLDGDELLAIEEGDTLRRCYGVAIDIGTTTVVVYLIDLIKGKILSSGAATNPQQAFGADVISRITYASHGCEGIQNLQEKVVEGLNEIIDQLCIENRVNQKEIYRAVVVGNTTMSHLFLGIDPTYLASAPFVPVFRQGIEIEASTLGLSILASAKVVVMPNIAGYVGSDTVAVMLAAEVDKLTGINLIIDIGTNGEIILAGKGRVLTCSTAAGPAFEGAEIKYGMRAAEGAIEGVIITTDVQINVIGGEKARGICGSGLIDAVAQMLRCGVIDTSGRIASTKEQMERLPELIRERCRPGEQSSEFVLVWSKDSALGEDIVLTQKDISQLQLAKGAIMAGILILLGKLEVEIKDIDQIMLAGAFGNYIKKESAVSIGLLPPVPLDHILSIGNAAGSGAKMALLSDKEKVRAEKLAVCVEHFELANEKHFQEEFIQSLYF